MRTLLVAPHADDESLFAAYLAQRYFTTVAVVYDEGRERELASATQWLGCTYQQLPIRKGAPAEVVERYLSGLRDQRKGDQWERFILPGYHPEGHEEHNLVSRVGQRVFTEGEVILYATYGPRGERTRPSGCEVFPENPEHVARKLAALSCYRSQIADPATGPWFYSLLDMREWQA